MRKLFTSLKAVVGAALIASMTLAASCSYDDSAINNRVNKVEEAIKALEDRVKALEDHATAVDKLIDELVVVTDVTVDGDKTTVTLSDGTSFVVYGACDTLQYRVVDGVLEVSADGETWVAVEQTSDCVIVGVVVNDDNTVTFTLANGQEFTVAKAEVIEFAATRGQVYVAAGTTKDVNFTINDAVVDINVMNQPFGWSATVAEATEVEGGNNGGGAAPMPLAAGGTDYVLQITGPTKDLVNAGFAAKEGVVSVHFNTAAGACKVLKVDVNLAEVTLTVDKNGVVTITNTMVEMYSGHQGDYLDFADYYIGIMPKARYEEYGNAALREGFYWGDYEGGSVTTKRSTGLSSYNTLYEEGVVEVEVTTLTVDQLGNCFWPTYTFNYGEESIIFISMESEVVDYYEVPLLDNAIMVEYKKALVDAQLVEGSATWNNVTYNMSLAGYSMYVVGWISDVEAQDYMMNMGYENIEDFLAAYIPGYGLMSAGAIIGGTILDEEVELASLAEMSLGGWAPEIASDTTYHFFIYPFNAVTEMDLYTHEFDPANLYYFGTFETAPLVAGDFEVNVECNVTKLAEKEVYVDVTFDGDYKVYYNWFDSPSYDQEQTIATILSDVYTVSLDVYAGETEEFSKYMYYGLPDPLYLAMLIINENGEYVYVEEEMVYIEPVLPVVEILTFEYLGRSQDLDDNESTSGGDYVYALTCADETEYTMGFYWEFAETDGTLKEGVYTYCTNYLDYMSSYWSGFVVLGDTYYYDSTVTVTAETITWKIPGEVQYVYTFGAEGGEEPVEPEEPEEPAIVELVSASAAPAASNFIGGTGYDVTFLDAEGNAIVFQVQTKGNAYLREGSWNDQEYSWSDVGYINSVVWPGVIYPWPYEMEVEVVDGAYYIVLATMDWEAEGQPVYQAYFNGQIEGMTLPVEEEEVETELPNCENLTLQLCTADDYESIGFSAGYGDIRLVDAEGKNYINIEINDQSVVTCSYVHSGNPTGTSMAPGTIYEGNTYVSYSGPAPLTTQTPKVSGGTMDVVVDGDNCTITINFTLQDGNTFTGTYTGVKPF